MEAARRVAARVKARDALKVPDPLAAYDLARLTPESVTMPPARPAANPARNEKE